jgi:hypothetical protein
LRGLVFLKCLDGYYIDFLTYLNGLEITGLKIYDLFRAIYSGEVDVNPCYRELSKTYIALEATLGDPRLALHTLGNLVGKSKLSSFLKEYSSVLLTTGDTKTLVSSELRSEFESLRAKISEYMRVVEVLYEVVLVIVLGLSMLSIFPLFPLQSITGSILLVLAWGFGYALSTSILGKMFFEVNPLVFTLDSLYLTMGGLITPLLEHGPIIHVLSLLILHLFAGKAWGLIKSLERESIRIFENVYSKSMLGESMDIALAGSMSSSTLREYRILWYGFLNGVDLKRVAEGLKLPILSRRITALLTSLTMYSRLDNSYVAAIGRYIDEILSLRRYVAEKSRFYILYSVFTAFLILISYYMIARIPGATSGVEVLALYGYLGVLVVSTPPCVMRDGGLTPSRSFLLVSTLGLSIYFSLKTLLY